MSAVIDTLRFSDKLRASGFTQTQADALARALSEELLERLATKEDINAVREAIAKLEMATKDDIARLEGVMATKEDIKALDDKVERLIASQNAEFNAKFGALNAKFNFTMALLGLLVALQFIPLGT